MIAFGSSVPAQRNSRGRRHQPTELDRRLCYRRLIANKYDGSTKRRVGRPSTKPDIVSLVVRMAQENPTLGYTRIRGGLQHLGPDIARNTIKAILQNHGIEPAPQRRTKTPWKTFLAAHWDSVAAVDFFTVEVLTWRGLVRYVVFFVMKLKTRTVEIAGITSQRTNTGCCRWHEISPIRMTASSGACVT